MDDAMKQNGTGKYLKLFLAAVIVIALMPAPALAEEIAVSADEVERALAQGEPGAEKTIRLAVLADDDAEQLVVRLHAEQILAIQGDHLRNLVVYDTPLGEFAFIPAWDMEALSQAFGVPAEDIRFEATMAKPNEEQLEQIRQAAESQGLALLTEPVAVDMEFWANDEFLTDEGVIGYFTQWLPAEPAVDWEHSAGMYYVPETGKIHFTPATSSIRDDRQMLTTMTCGCGYYYAIVRNEKTKTFTDVLDDALRQAANRLAAWGVIQGTGGGVFQPDRLLTRAELAAMVARFFDMVMDGDAELAAEAFEDVDADDWFAGYAGALHRTGVLEDGAFNPDGHVTAEDIYNAFLVVPDIRFMLSFMDGPVQTGGPHVTRAEAVLILDQVLRAYELSIERAQQRSLQD